MKVSKITVEHVAKYLRLDDVPENLKDILKAAKSYMESYTGLPVSSAEGDCLDNHEDVTIAVLVLCREMYDNRTLYAEKGSSANKVIETILNMHCRNLL